MVTDTRNNEPTASVEWEMTVNQRGLVDTCFEEGQYETGIGILDSLRSPTMKPFPPHVRQLLYLALYPPLTSQEGEDPKNGSELGLPSSPSKLGSRHHKSILIPTLPTTIAAHDLLMAFAHTNTPESLFRALPSYSLSGSDSSFGDTQHPSEGDEFDDDSPIARQSRRIKEAKNCWEILKDNFIQPKTDFPVSPPRRTNRNRRHVNDDDSDDTDPEQLQAIAAHAWPVLYWIITVLEKDEDVTERSGRARHSPLLLSQIPPSRTPGGRWEVGIPLEIILHCLGQTAEKYTSLGVRLMTLLINLTNCDDLNVNMFMTAACSRLTSLESSQLSYLLSRLPRKPVNLLRFKLVLCRGLLKDPMSGITPNSNSRPKPTARAQPRPLPSRRRRADSAVGGTASATVTATVDGDQKPSATPATVLRKFPTTSSSDILRILAASDSLTSDTLATLRLKHELVRSFIVMQISEETENPADAACWHGQLIQAIEHTFTVQSRNQDIVEEVEDMKITLLAFVEAAAP